MKYIIMQLTKHPEVHRMKSGKDVYNWVIKINVPAWEVMYENTTAIGRSTKLRNDEFLNFTKYH
jgi:hypothetical protein